jgi:hypothetical protein
MDTMACERIGRASGASSTRLSNSKPSVPSPDGRILVEVHQRVLDKDGGTLLDGRVQHIYSIRDGLVWHMEIRDPSEYVGFQVP